MSLQEQWGPGASLALCSQALGAMPGPASGSSLAEGRDDHDYCDSRSDSACPLSSVVPGRGELPQPPGSTRWTARARAAVLCTPSPCLPPPVQGHFQFEKQVAVTIRSTAEIGGRNKGAEPFPRAPPREFPGFLGSTPWWSTWGHEEERGRSLGCV